MPNWVTPVLKTYDNGPLYTHVLTSCQKQGHSIEVSRTTVTRIIDIHVYCFIVQDCGRNIDWLIFFIDESHSVQHKRVGYWPALRAGLLCCNFFGQPGSVSKFPPFLWVKLWVGWVGRGYTEISRYFPASWINLVTLVTKIKLLYSLRF